MNTPRRIGVFVASGQIGSAGGTGRRRFICTPANRFNRLIARACTRIHTHTHAHIYTYIYTHARPTVTSGPVIYRALFVLDKPRDVDRRNRTRNACRCAPNTVIRVKLIYERAVVMVIIIIIIIIKIIIIIITIIIMISQETDVA